MWLFSQVSGDQVIQGFGLQAGIVIIVQAVVIVILWRKLEKIQDQRLSEAREVNADLVEPLKELIKNNKASTALNRKIYDAVNKKRGA